MSTPKSTKKAKPKRTKSEAMSVSYSSPTNEVAQILCKNCRIIFEESKMSRKDFADLLGVSDGYIAKVNNGYMPPAHIILVRLADKFRVSMDWLYGRSKY